MRATALQVLKFADKLGLSSFDLLGTSRGGAVAMCAAAEASARDRTSRSASHLGMSRQSVFVPRTPAGAFLWYTCRSNGHFAWPVRSRGRLFLSPFWHGRLFADRSKIPPGSLEGYKAPLAIPGLFEHGLSIVKTWTADLRELENLAAQAAADSSASDVGRQRHCRVCFIHGSAGRAFRECAESGLSRTLDICHTKSAPKISIGR